MTKQNNIFTVFTLLFALALSACAQQTPTATPTPAPSLTPTDATPLVILLTSPQSETGLSNATFEIVSKYASDHGMQFKHVTVLNPAEMPPSLQKLVVLAPDPGVSALAAAATQAQVITIGFAGDPNFGNITSLPLSGDHESQVAFIAGLIAAMSAEDWRAGVLYTGGRASIVNDFVTGAEYFCGSCDAVSPPYVNYPVIAQADAQNWQSAIDLLLSQSVHVVYLTPDLETSGAAQYLANFGALIIGNGAPPPDLANSWLVSISSDPTAALRQLLPLALDGQPLNLVSAISLSNANTDLLSESRMSFVQQVIDDLLAGYIQLPTD